MAENEKKATERRTRHRLQGTLGKIKEKVHEITGGRDDEPEEKEKSNLILLGVIAVGIAILTTGVSVLIYHKSGDIYLDRSRPGFLPDEEEIQSEPEREEYDFSDSGEINKEILDEYLEHYMEELNGLDEYTEPFSDKPLSDESLGI